MNLAFQARLPSLDEALTFSPQQIVDLVRSQRLLRQEIEVLKHQLEWFKRQIFGQKSERRIIDGADGQMSLGEAMSPEQASSPPPPAERTGASPTRRSAAKAPDAGDDSVPFSGPNTSALCRV